jgi:hypothetical protein
MERAMCIITRNYGRGLYPTHAMLGGHPIIYAEPGTLNFWPIQYLTDLATYIHASPDNPCMHSHIKIDLYLKLAKPVMTVFLRVNQGLA